jgi:hypothetical protein
MADEKTFTADKFDDIIMNILGDPFQFDEERDERGKVVKKGVDMTLRIATMFALDTASDRETPFMETYRRRNVSRKVEEAKGPITLNKSEVKSIKECSGKVWFRATRVMSAIWDRFDPEGLVDLPETLNAEPSKKKE